MIPVAASRRDGGAGAVSPKEKSNMASKILLALSALLSKPVETDEDAVTQLNTVRTTNEEQARQLSTLTEFQSVIGAEFDGETETPKVLAKITALKAKVTELTAQAASGAVEGRKAIVDRIIAKHEKKLSVPAKAMFARNLNAELEAGVKEGATETEKVLETMKEIPQLAGKDSLADNGTNATDSDGTATAAFEAKRAELYRTDPDIVEMAKRNPNQAYALSVSKATKALGAGA
jgi:hypothetical protein